MTDALSLLAIVLALALGYAVGRARYQPSIAQRRADMLRQIERARKSHAPVNHLYREAQELTTKELAS